MRSANDMTKAKDLSVQPESSVLFVGAKFGRLTLARWVSGHRWLTRCECGTPKEVDGHSLTRKLESWRLQPSCGCLTRQARRERAATTVADRFWAKVQKTDGCWLWTAERTPGGYGRFNEPLSGPPAIKFAHRVSWMLEHGEYPPSDLDVCHKCDIPPCVRPDHLFLGTAQDNANDMKAKGRSATGKRNGNPARFTPEEAEEVRRRVRAGEQARTVARSIGCNESTVSYIVNRCKGYE